MTVPTMFCNNMFQSYADYLPDYPLLYGAYVSTDSLSQQFNRFDVGTRKALQETLRITPESVRQYCIFLQMPTSGHTNSTSHGGSNSQFVIVNSLGINHFKNLEPVDSVNNSITGLKDMTYNLLSLQYSFTKAILLFYRMRLSKIEPYINSSVFSYLPFEIIYSPWDIPGADNYHYLNRLWNMDCGGKSNLYLDYTYTPRAPVLNIPNLSIPIDPNGISFNFTVNGNSNTEGIYIKFNVSNPLQSQPPEMTLTSPDGTLFSYNLNGNLPSDYFILDLRDSPLSYKTTGVWNLLLVNLAVYTPVSGNPNTNGDLNISEIKFGLTLGDNDPGSDQTLQSNRSSLTVRRDTVNIRNLPTSTTGLQTGDLYIDTNTGNVKIML